MFCFKDSIELNNFENLSEAKKITEISFNGKKYSYNYLINGGIRIFLNLLKIEINCLETVLENYSSIYKNIFDITIFLYKPECGFDFSGHYENSFTQDILRIRSLSHSQNYKKQTLLHHLSLLLCFSLYKLKTNEYSEYLLISTFGLFCLNKFHLSCNCMATVVHSLKDKNFNIFYKRIFEKENMYYTEINDSVILETIIHCEFTLTEFSHSFDFKLLDKFLQEPNGLYFEKIINFIQKIFSNEVIEDERIYLFFNQSKTFINKDGRDIEINFEKFMIPSKIVHKIENDIVEKNFEDRSVYENFICLMVLIFKNANEKYFFKFEKLITTHFDSSLKELNFMTFYHMSLHFLSFSQLFQQSTESICHELMKRFELIGFNSKFDSDTMRCITCAYFSMYVIFRQKRIYAADICQNLKTFLINMLKSYIEKSYSWNKIASDKSNFINYYLESLQDILDYIIEDYSFFKDLFYSCFSSIISSDNTGFVQRCVFIMQKVIRDFGPNRNHIECSEICFSIMEFIKDLIYSKHGKTFSNELASLTFHSLKILSNQYKAKIQEWISRVLFTTFICPNYTVQFWSIFIDDIRFRDLFLTNELQIKLMSFWLESMFEYSTEFFSQLSVVISRIPAFSDFIPNNSSSSIYEIFESFLRNIKFHESKLLNTDEKLSFHKRIIDFMHVFKKIFSLHSSKSNNQKILLYHTCSKLVEYIPQIIYKKSNTACIFPFIIDQLFLSNVSNFNQNNILENLKSILYGFSQIDFDKDEYVRRKLVQIFHRYYVSCLKIYTDFNDNPFFNVLKPTFHGESNILKLRIFFYEMINIYMTDNIDSVDENLMCLKYLYSLIDSTSFDENNQKNISQFMSIVYIGLLSLFIHDMIQKIEDNITFYCNLIIIKTLKNSNYITDELIEPSILFINVYSIQFPKQVTAVINFLMKIDKDVFIWFPDLVRKYTDKRHPIRAFMS